MTPEMFHELVTFAMTALAMWFTYRMMRGD